MSSAASQIEPIQGAASALRAGRLVEAETLLDAVLSKDPECAEAHNLSVRLLLRQRDPLRALHHAKKAVELCPTHPDILTNLGIVYAELRNTGLAMKSFTAAIEAQPRHHLARWFRGRVNLSMELYKEAEGDLAVAVKSDPTRAKPVIALAETMAKLGKFDKANNVLKHAAKLGASNTSEWSYVRGCVMYQRGMYRRAREEFAKALSTDADDIKNYVALAVSSYKCGDLHDAQKVTQACVNRFPVNERVGDKEPGLCVLVLEGLGFGHKHFCKLTPNPNPYAYGNFIAAMPRGPLAYTHALVDFRESIDAALSANRFHLAFNNCANPERTELELQDQIRLNEEISEVTGLPVVNRPEAVAQCTRQANAERFSNTESFVFPRTLRVAHEIDVSLTKAQILDNLRMPIILRPVDTQVGYGAAIVRTEVELEQRLARTLLTDLYAIEYHDCCGNDGLFRRYRIASIGGEFVPVNLDAATGWNVHSSQRRALSWADNGLDKEERSFLFQPEIALGGQPEEIFKEIVEKTPLDIYGFDFGRRPDGQCVVFEINSAMAFNSNIKVAQYPYLSERRDQIVSMIEEYFWRRSGQTGRAEPS